MGDTTVVNAVVMHTPRQPCFVSVQVQGPAQEGTIAFGLDGDQATGTPPDADVRVLGVFSETIPEHEHRQTSVQVSGSASVYAADLTTKDHWMRPVGYRLVMMAVGEAKPHPCAVVAPYDGVATVVGTAVNIREGEAVLLIRPYASFVASTADGGTAPGPDASVLSEGGGLVAVPPPRQNITVDEFDWLTVSSPLDNNGENEDAAEDSDDEGSGEDDDGDREGSFEVSDVEREEDDRTPDAVLAASASGDAPSDDGASSATFKKAPTPRKNTPRKSKVSARNTHTLNDISRLVNVLGRMLNNPLAPSDWVTDARHALTEAKSVIAGAKLVNEPGLTSEARQGEMDRIERLAALVMDKVHTLHAALQTGPDDDNDDQTRWVASLAWATKVLALAERSGALVAATDNLMLDGIDKAMALAKANYKAHHQAVSPAKPSKQPDYLSANLSQAGPSLVHAPAAVVNANVQARAGPSLPKKRKAPAGPPLAKARKKAATAAP